MKELDLKAIRDRAYAATPGPWVWVQDSMMSGPLEAIITTDGGYYGPDRTDRAFIANARDDIPALLDLIEELEDKVSELKDKVSELRTLYKNVVEISGPCT